MLAIRRHAFGGPDELRLEELPDPHPGERAVRIRTEIAGVHLLDCRRCDTLAVTGSP